MNKTAKLICCYSEGIGVVAFVVLSASNELCKLTYSKSWKCYETINMFCGYAFSQEDYDIINYKQTLTDCGIILKNPNCRKCKYRFKCITSAL